MNIDVEKISFLSVENYKEHLENVLNIFSNRFVFFKKTRSFFENVEKDQLHFRLIPVMLTFEQLSQLHEENPYFISQDTKEIYEANQLFWRGFFMYESTPNKKMGMYLMYKGVQELKGKMSKTVQYFIDNNADDMLWNYRVYKAQEILSKVNIEYKNKLFFNSYIKEVRFNTLISFYKKKKSGGILSEVKDKILRAREQSRRIVENNQTGDRFILNRSIFDSKEVLISAEEVKQKLSISSNVEKISIIENYFNQQTRKLDSKELAKEKTRLLNSLKNLNLMENLNENSDVIMSYEVGNVFGKNLVTLVDMLNKINESNISILIEHCNLNSQLIEKIITGQEENMMNIMKVKNQLLKEKVQNL